MTLDLAPESVLRSRTGLRYNAAAAAARASSAAARRARVSASHVSSAARQT